MKFKEKYKIVYCKDEHCSEFDNGMFSNYNTYEYYKGYLVHREDGPAIECNNGHKRWLLNGKLHREDGPAIECSYGDKEWYLNNKEYSEKEYWKIINLFKNKKKVLNEI